MLLLEQAAGGFQGLFHQVPGVRVEGEVYAPPFDMRQGQELWNNRRKRDMSFTWNQMHGCVVGPQRSVGVHDVNAADGPVQLIEELREAALEHLPLPVLA